VEKTHSVGHCCHSRLSVSGEFAQLGDEGLPANVHATSDLPVLLEEKFVLFPVCGKM
jgi:hypothetical protein